MTPLNGIVRRRASADVCHWTVFLLDVSQSMEQEDWPPSRLQGAISAFSRLLDVKAASYPGDQVGVVAFSNIVVVQHPLIPVEGNRQAILASMASIVTGPRTDTASGLRVAHSMFSGPPHLGGRRPLQAAAAPHRDAVRQIILLTDGETNEGDDPVAAAETIRREGVEIDVIGIGSPSRLDHTSLRQIASPGPDGTCRYNFIGDVRELHAEMDRLAHHHIMPLVTGA